MVNNGLRYHLKDSIFTVFGTVSGLLIIAVLSSFSIQGVFHISAQFYTTLKIVGAIYLFYLGIKNILSKGEFKLDSSSSREKPQKRKLYYEALFCCLTNPKILFLYVALLPNYIISGKNIFIQNFILSLIQISVVTIAMITYLLIANKAAKLFISKIRYVRFISGSVMIILAMTLLFSI